MDDAAFRCIFRHVHTGKDTDRYRNHKREENEINGVEKLISNAVCIKRENLRTEGFDTAPDYIHREGDEKQDEGAGHHIEDSRREMIGHMRPLQ